MSGRYALRNEEGTKDDVMALNHALMARAEPEGRLFSRLLENGAESAFNC